MRILVVEDDRLLNNTLCYNLNTAGYAVDSALTKSAAGSFLTEQDYDLIVLDEDDILTINFSEMSATLSGKPLTFTPLEYRLLKILMKNPQIVLTRQVLLEKLWDADGNFVDEHALTAAISRVRNKIETPDRQYIKTVYGIKKKGWCSI